MHETLNYYAELIFLVFLLIILTSVIICFYSLKSSNKFIENSIITKAKILSTTLTSAASYYYVEYNDLLGRKLEGRVHSVLPMLKKEDEIEIRYDKENHSKLKINDKLHIFAFAIGILISAFFNFAILFYLVYIGVAAVPF